MTDVVDRYASRKFWMAVVFQLIFTVMLCYGKLPSPVFENLTYMLLGGYFISNVTQKIFVKGADVQNYKARGSWR